MKIEKGITLIALVIMIVVILILAGVSIDTLTGENGILKKASKAKEETEDANIKEQISITELINQVDTYTSNIVNVTNQYNQEVGYINYQGNIVNEASSRYIRIPVTSGETWFIWYKEPSRLSTCPLRYENNLKEKIDYINMAQQPQYHFNPESNKYGITVNIPEGTSYICVTLKFTNSYDFTQNAFIAKVNDTSSSTWITVGDSLTEFNNTASKNWLQLSSAILSANYYNIAHGGRGYAMNGGFRQYFNNLPENADIDLIIFFGSFNDMSTNIPVGNASDQFVEEGSNSLAAHMNYCYDYMKTNYPDAKMVVISPSPWKMFNPSDTYSKASQYVEVMKDICNLKDIPFLDLFHTSGLKPWEEKYNNKYFYNADGTHPNNEGQKILATKIIPFLQKNIK